MRPFKKTFSKHYFWDWFVKISQLFYTLEIFHSSSSEHNFFSGIAWIYKEVFTSFNDMILEEKYYFYKVDFNDHP